MKVYVLFVISLSQKQQVHEGEVFGNIAEKRIRVTSTRVL